MGEEGPSPLGLLCLSGRKASVSKMGVVEHEKGQQPALSGVKP